MYKGAGLIVSGIVFVLFFHGMWGCKGGAYGQDTWGVLYASLPGNILAENIEEGAVDYIFRQTHEPLFRQEDGQNYTSRVLDGWSRNIDYSEFTFCPDSTLMFDAETPFTPDFLYSFLNKVTSKYNKDYTVARSGKCSAVKFRSGQPGYLYFLARHENAPSMVKGAAQCGLGAFSIKKVSKTLIELERKGRVKRGYNRIQIFLYDGAEDSDLGHRRVSDFNRLSSFQRPEWVQSEYMGFDNIELRVVGLAINHPDIRVRRALYGCLDADEFRRAVVPARKDFYDVQTVLPMGVPGASGGIPRQVCEVPRWMKGTKVVFANPRTDNLAEMIEFAKKFNKKTGLELVVKNYKTEEMDAVLLDKKQRNSYNLAIVVTANPRPDQEGFFVFYAGKDRVINHVPEDMLRMFRSLEQERDPAKKKHIAEKLAADLGERGFVIPLYQTFTRLYYPPGIKNLSVGRGFSEIPDVAALRW